MLKNTIVWVRFKWIFRRWAVMTVRVPWQSSTVGSVKMPRGDRDCICVPHALCWSMLALQEEGIMCKVKPQIQCKQNIREIKHVTLSIVKNSWKWFFPYFLCFRCDKCSKSFQAICSSCKQFSYVIKRTCNLFIFTCHILHIAYFITRTYHQIYYFVF